MLLFKNLFGNFSGFNELFGMVEHGNGAVSRKNAILLTLFKSREVLDYARRNPSFDIMEIRNMARLKRAILVEARNGMAGMEGVHPVELGDSMKLYSMTYATDDARGVCEDGDERSVRYVNCENNRSNIKMRSGKFLRKVLLESEIGRCLPEQVLVWLCEEFSTEWRAYVKSKVPQNKLVVSSDAEAFSRIYDSCHLKGHFGSCMVDRDYHSFYSDSVDSSAAYLEDAEGRIIARCIIFNSVTDEDGKVWRLAERQYSSDGDETLKLALVNRLIEQGCIDGYKRVGAGCNDSRSFVDNQGNDLSNHDFRIACRLDFGDTLSYQDSFKFYNMREHTAYNSMHAGCSFDLATTEGEIEGGNWDSYHECYTTNDVATVYVGGVRYYCDEERLDDFRYVEYRHDYYHEDDVVYCECCEEYVLSDDAEYSEITDQYYCSERCRYEAEEEYCAKRDIPYSTITRESYETWDDLSEAELEYKRENWFFSALLGEYFERVGELERAEREHRESRRLITDYLGNEIPMDSAVMYYKTFVNEPGTFSFSRFGRFMTCTDGRLVDGTKYTDTSRYRIIRGAVFDVNPETGDVYEDAKKIISNL